MYLDFSAFGQLWVSAWVVDVRSSLPGVVYCLSAGLTTTCPVPLQRSKTAFVVSESRPQGFVDLERQARSDAERAMKVATLYCNAVY